MDEIKLRYFTSVARHLSFTKAAEDQHVVQATISKQIAALERELGVPLFYRDHQSVRLTPAGARLASDSEDYMEQYRAINSSVRKLALELDKKLRIGIGPYEYTLLAEPLRLFSQRNPNVEIICSLYTYQRLVSHFRSGTIDVGICTAACAAAVERVVSIPLLREKWIAAAAEHSPFWDLPYARQAVLDGQMVITLFENQFEPVRPHCIRNDFRHSAFALSNQLLTQLTMIRSGVGIGLLPSHLTKDVGNGLCWDRDLPRVPLYQTVVAGYDPSLRNSAAVRFIDCCREVYSPNAEELAVHI